MKVEPERAAIRRTRALRAVAVAIVGALVLATVCFFGASSLSLMALFTVPMAGAFGAAAEDIRVTHEQYRALQAEADSLNAAARGLVHLSLELVAAALLATIFCAWQARADTRRWHWLSFVGLAGLVALMVLAGGVGTSEPMMLGLLGLDAVALVFSLVDLKRRQYGAPGRIIAWATCLLAVVVGALFWSEALGPNGVIGRWLRYG